MSHSPHPDIHEAGLADNCADCTEYAAFPLRLDDAALRDLVTRTLSNRFGYAPGDEPGVAHGSGERVEARSRTELVAMAEIMNALERTGRLASVVRDPLEWYLAERWHLRCEIVGPNDLERFPTTRVEEIR